MKINKQEPLSCCTWVEHLFSKQLMLVQRFEDFLATRESSQTNISLHRNVSRYNTTKDSAQVFNLQLF
jgi:hypothetical protein